MLRQIQFLACLVLVVLGGGPDAAAQVYSPPTGGWTYIFTGEAAAGGADFTALDGTWNHANGSDEWDESDIGGGSPGGVSGGLTDGSTTYIRMQDTGDPRDYGFADPGSNRKYYFGHDITAEGASDTILDEGVTLSFRTRIATGDPLDEAHPDGGSATVPWPTAGDGYGIHDGGKSSFSIHQNAGGTISFALANETDGEAGSVLRMNSLNGTAPSAAVDTGEGTANILSISDATDWHEFWITIQSGGAGTHQVRVFNDGGGVPTVFDVTAGDGNDFTGIRYIATGLGSTGQAGAIDVDFFAWKAGLFDPGTSVAAGDFNADGVINNADFIILSNNLAEHLDGADVGFEQGDFDFDGDVDLDDFGQFKAAFPGAVGQGAAIPEPATAASAISVALVAGVAAARRRGHLLARRRLHSGSVQSS
jgi:hypothetical protein